MEIGAGFAQVNWKFTGSAAPRGAEVTMGWDLSAYPNTPEELAADAAATWVDTFLTFQSSAIELSSVLAKYGPNNIGPSAEISVGEVGGQSNATFPPQVSVLVRKLTSAGGRAGRGRFFIPGVGETTANESGIIPSDILGNWQGQADDFIDAMVGFGLVPVVLHGADSPITVPSPITSLQVSNTVGTQRRRLRG
jgi:hypothetical protein